MKRIIIATIIVCAISFTVGLPINEGFSAEGIKVLGKATIKAGVQLNGVIMLSTSRFNSSRITGFRFISFKDQTMYIIEKIETEGNVISGYILDGDGFSHACPTHGPEIMKQSMIAVPQSIIDSGDVTIKLF